ncbi:hypothetical protein SAMN04489735_100246 [Aneurinibacillus thermoaerophilus]|uniref:Lipoprotein n=1 Tax=Aneurinibacillus thermoaerophilus TaxID=143495 RepID=A0A1G7WPE8_ANETH|nr:hypothetical protein SAMN04489735_100246 [Aneurinibacillus thermoaerophilus]
MRIFWLFCFYLSLISGLAGCLAVMFDVLLFKENIFTLYEISQFIILILLAIFIRMYILPKYKNKFVKRL